MIDRDLDPGTSIVRIVSPAPRADWLDIVRSDLMAFVYQSPDGIDAICASSGREDASRLYEFVDGRRLVVPLTRQVGRPRSMRIETGPKVGAVVSGDQLGPADIALVLDDLADVGALSVQMTPGPLRAEQWDAVVPPDVTRLPRRSHVVDLDGGFDAVWTGCFNGKARSRVRKAEKSGVEVASGVGVELFSEFYELYRASNELRVREAGGPSRLVEWRVRRLPSADGLRARLSSLGSAARTWIARVDGEPAATIVVLQGANAHYTMGGMRRELATRVQANYLLHRCAIEEACERGSRFYSMGESGTSESLGHFKKQFGAVEYDYFEYRFERVPITSLERRVRGLGARLVRP